MTDEQDKPRFCALPLERRVVPLPCPFCGRAPYSIGRPTTPGETCTSYKFLHFFACHCGGYSATAHKMGRGASPDEAERDAVEQWNVRHNVELRGDQQRTQNDE